MYKDPKTGVLYPSKEWMFAHTPTPTIPIAPTAIKEKIAEVTAKVKDIQSVLNKAEEMGYGIGTGKDIPSEVYEAAGVEPIKEAKIASVQEKITGTKAKIEDLQNVLDKAEEMGYGAGTGLDIPDEVYEAAGVKEPPEAGAEFTIPDWLKDNEYFQQLSEDEQRYIVNYYNILKINDKERQDILKQALIDAQAAADPYFAEQIRIAQDELLGALGEKKEDFASQQRDLQLKIDQIKEDLITGKERLTVDQQAELGRQQRQYKYQLEDLIERARHVGLTFSTKRALAEARLTTEQEDIVESTKRGFQRQLEDLQLRSARGEVEATNLLKDYERMYGVSVTKLLRGAERELGTKGLGMEEYEGYKPLGGVTGILEEEKLKDITTRAQALVSLRSPFF